MTSGTYLVKILWILIPMNVFDIVINLALFRLVC